MGGGCSGRQIGSGVGRRPVAQLQFSRSGTSLLALSGRRMICAWDLSPREPARDDDILPLVWLNSGQEISEQTVRSVPLTNEKFRRSWQRVAMARQGDFAAARQPWHWRQMLEAAELGQWTAALWHL